MNIHLLTYALIFNTLLPLTIYCINICLPYYLQYYSYAVIYLISCLCIFVK